MPPSISASRRNLDIGSCPPPPLSSSWSPSIPPPRSTHVDPTSAVSPSLWVLSSMMSQLHLLVSEYTNLRTPRHQPQKYLRSRFALFTSVAVYCIFGLVGCLSMWSLKSEPRLSPSITFTFYHVQWSDMGWCTITFPFNKNALCSFLAEGFACLHLFITDGICWTTPWLEGANT